MFKKCYKCKENKDIINFGKCNRNKDGLNNLCKDCKRELGKNYYQNNKEKFEKYKEENKEKIKKNSKIYREKNKEKLDNYYNVWLNNNEKKLKEYRKNYYQNNKEKKLKYSKEYQKSHKDKRNLYLKIRKEDDLVFKFKCNIRSFIYYSLKRKGYNKKFFNKNILGIGYEDCLDYLFENAILRYPDFEPKDFLEKNKYHIDHIIPLATAKTEEDVIRLCHYTNLQILTAKENLEKSSHYGD